jgi:VWFA-related protein
MQIGKRSWPWGVALTLLALAAYASRLDGQDRPVVSEPPITAIDRSWPDVNLNVLVLDKSGTPQKIDEQAFQIFEDRTERPLRFPASEDSPLSLAFLIDTSGSTYQRKSDIVSAVAAIIHGLPADSEVMAASFADKSYLEFPFTPVSKVDLSFMDRVPAAGPTALYDAVWATERYFIANAKYPRRALVVLSDGEENASHGPIRTAFATMNWPGAPMFYACRVRDPRKSLDQFNESVVGHENLWFLTRRGGGKVFELEPDPAAAAAQILAAIRSQHVLQFTAANPVHDGKEHKLEVKIRVKDVRIYGLPFYFAPPK